MDNHFLSNPLFLELDDAYRSLPKFSEISIKTSEPQRVLAEMEKIGFVAMRITLNLNERTVWTIQATKGKHGPCKFTGKYTAYTGSALAALDDDLHLLPANQPIEVCDKTFAVHMLPAYKNLIIDRSEASRLTKAQKKEPDDFDTTLGKLYQHLRSINPEPGAKKMLFYPGPFRLLILHNGSIVRRGEWNAVPETFVSNLKKVDGLIEILSNTDVKPVYLQEKYEQKGAFALMDIIQLIPRETNNNPADLSYLVNLRGPLRERILKLIKERKKYFVLVGSDLTDEFGCCPSEEVTEANRLVKKGILSAYTEKVPGESCPLTFYALKGELTVTDTGLESECDDQQRATIHRHLTRTTSTAKKIIKWALLVFVLISIMMAANKWLTFKKNTSGEISYERIRPLINGQLNLVLFHNAKRCFQCSQIERLTLEVIEKNFDHKVLEQRLVFKATEIDDPLNQALVSHLGIFSASLVLMEFEDGTMTNAYVLADVPKLYRDEAAFKTYLKSELEKKLSQ